MFAISSPIQRALRSDGLFSKQFATVSRMIDFEGQARRMRVTLRFDDRCGNGHNTFSLTGEIGPKSDPIVCGAIHDDIREYFPELAPLIRWHLCSTDGPMHYIANTCYLAGNTDAWGKTQGEPSAYADFAQFEGFPIEIKLRGRFARWLQSRSDDLGAVYPVEHQREPEKFGPKFTIDGYPCKWHQAPFDTRREAQQFRDAWNQHNGRVVEQPTAWAKGKARELDAAREAACWPDATDAELCQPREALARQLQQRLPGLLDEFRADMEALGFHWTEAEIDAA